MADEKVSVLDVLARLDKVERENEVLKKEVADLKTGNLEDEWTELILYRPLHKQTPVEITWTEDDDKEKQRYYREDEPMRREVIGLIRKPR